MLNIKELAPEGIGKIIEIVGHPTISIKKKTLKSSNFADDVFCLTLQMDDSYECFYFTSPLSLMNAINTLNSNDRFYAVKTCSNKKIVDDFFITKLSLDLLEAIKNNQFVLN